MKLVAFSVTNYRSITSAYKLPMKQTTVLIGPNNEGKSNILRALVTALEILSSLAGASILKGRLRPYARTDSYDWRKDFPMALQGIQLKVESIFALDFQLSADEITDFETEVGSKLNGTLPIELKIGLQEISFRITKKGPGALTLSQKSESIARFVAKRININYIPAVRTAEGAHEIVTEIVSKELAIVEKDNEYIRALGAVAKLQQPVLDRISASIKDTLKEFLPNVKNVKVSIPQEARFRALRRACEIIVDDGTPTQLARKGDGVQSLAALSLMRHASASTSGQRDLILAIEEPESHLHPNAIHQLKSVLTDIGRKHQVIMTTHCPLFVDRASIKSNILVHNNKASPAKDVRQIREILGVRAADNLQHAELILLVEGEDDRISLRSLLSHNSAPLKVALSQGTLAIDTLRGGSNLAYKLTQVREAVCLAYCFLDHDKAGIEAFDKAEKEGLVTPAEVTMASCAGMKESEMEDLFDESLYNKMLFNKYGIPVNHPKFRGNNKWSDRVRETFKALGKPWSDQMEAKVKLDVAELAADNPATALNSHKRNSFDALCEALTSKLNVISVSKK
jgi:putative ATP-dependent endonuclease of OLD family